MGFQPVKWLNPLDGFDPIWTPGNQNQNKNQSLFNKLFSLKGIALAGIIVFAWTKAKGDY